MENEMKLDMTKKELSRREYLEGIVTESKAAFIECGNALLEIRDARLYRSTHSSFEAYCKDTWGFKRAHASRLIAAAGLSAKLSPQGDIVKTQQHARVLLAVPQDKLEAVVERAVSEGKTDLTQLRQIIEDVKYEDLTDATGHPVPEDLRGEWMEASKVGKEIQTAGRALKRTVDEHLDQGDKYIQRHNLDKTMSKDIGDVVAELGRTIPYAVCPFCEGNGKRCPNCHSRGWLSKIYYNQHVPAKMKNGKNGN